MNQKKQNLNNELEGTERFSAELREKSPSVYLSMGL